MDNIIRQLAIELRFLPSDLLESNNTDIPSENNILQILKHPFDLDFIAIQMQLNTNVLVLVENDIIIHIASQRVDNVRIDTLTRRLQEEFNMENFAKIESVNHFPFKVVTISSEEIR